jgi:uncharacterized protein (TIGR02217 family)
MDKIIRPDVTTFPARTVPNLGADGTLDNHVFILPPGVWTAGSLTLVADWVIPAASVYTLQHRFSYDFSVFYGAAPVSHSVSGTYTDTLVFDSLTLNFYLHPDTGGTRTGSLGYILTSGTSGGSIRVRDIYLTLTGTEAGVTPQFDEIQLPVGISRGATFGPMFSTTVVSMNSGAEQRIAQWARGRYQGEINMTERTPAQTFDLVAFFLARFGKARGFRFKDWRDYSTEQPVPGTTHDTLLLTSTTFQLQKAYTFGTFTSQRKIVKPVGDDPTNTAATQANSTVHIYNGATEITSGWTVDLTTGIVTFSSAPGYLPAARFEFDTPVRFDCDPMDLAQPEAFYSNWERIPIVELLY